MRAPENAALLKKGPGDKKDAEGVVAETALIVFKPSPIHGIGGFAKTSISRGARVIEYLGQKITKDESVRRCAETNAYIFALDEHADLDGDVDWNRARFINHSCSPNCDAVLDNGRIWIVANNTISAGEEITFNYGYDLVDYKEYPCHCGSSNCVGYIVAEEFFKYLRKSRAGRESESRTQQVPIRG